MQELLFFVTSGFDEEDVRAVRRLVERLAVVRAWEHGAPELVNDDDPAAPRTLARTLGGRVFLAGDAVEHMKAVVMAVAELSSVRELRFEFELAGTWMGSIDAGEIDETVRVGLLTRQTESSGTRLTRRALALPCLARWRSAK